MLEFWFWNGSKSPETGKYFNFFFSFFKLSTRENKRGTKSFVLNAPFLAF